MKNRKFNAIDILIIFFAAVVIVGGTFAVNKFMNRESGETKQIVLEVLDNKKSFCDIVKTGETVYDGVENVQLGQIIAVETKPAETDSFSSIDGVIKHTTIPERYDMYLTIEIPQETDVLVGKQLWLETAAYKCSGYILEVNDGGKAAENR